jgi:MinD superfamily P-loop ATPase
MEDNKAKLNPYFCTGCGLCKLVCPNQAIQMVENQNGQINIKNNICSLRLISGEVYPGEEGSGRIVIETRQEAEKEKYDVAVIDAAPGTGCSVTAAVSGTDFAILMTEPTPSALADARKAIQIIEHFKIPFGIVINKSDLNPEVCQKIEQEFQDKILGRISYDKNIFKAISNLEPILKTNLKAKKEIEEIYKKLLVLIE